MDKSDNLHPMIYKAMESLEQGHISRREFLRLATLLGASVTTAALLASCRAPVSDPTPSPSVSNPTPSPAASTMAKKRGGTLRIGWIVGTSSNIDPTILRLKYEHLTRIDDKNISHPHLLEKWQPNEDLTRWTLHLKRGIKWANGDEFIADDVVQSLRRNLSEYGLFEGELTYDGIELVDEYTVRLNLEIPKLDIPEILYSDFAFITHREEINNNLFEGNNTGTGPFELDFFSPNEIARFVRRDGYWQPGEDGDPLPYLAEVEFKQLGSEDEPYYQALQVGDLNAGAPYPEGYLIIKDDPNYQTRSILTNWTSILRFRVDIEPWNDNRVRMAIKKLQNRQKILKRAWFDEGALGHDTHISPGHPEFSPMEVPEFDPEGAKELLQEAGMENLAFTIALIDDTEFVGYAEQLQEDARTIGVEISLDKMTEDSYWQVWRSTPVGITNWNHRTLAVQVLPLAYTADAEGNPVDWNETGWVDEEFSDLLAKAQLTRDLDARKKIMADLQRIQSQRGSIGIAYWKNVWLVHTPAFKDIELTPTGIWYLNETWYDPDLDPFPLKNLM